LLEEATTTVTVLFANSNYGARGNCSIVFPTPRVIAKTSAHARAAALELLKGPTQAERVSGFSSWIPAGTTLRSVSVSEETVTVDFNATLNTAAAGCRTDGIKAQIAQTFLQVPGVRNVLVNVEGQPSARFQP
jgi:spore germination protein GerM